MAGQPIICREAPAKINLTLKVLGARPDGFHEIESWAVLLSWFDQLRLSPAGHLTLTLHGTTRGVPDGESNLAYRAALVMAEAAGRDPCVLIELEKRIPPGAGLGGGSSDAAAVLTGLNELWGLGWSIDRLGEIAAGLGSDVPLFLDPWPALLRGRGERLERLKECWSGWVAVVVPPYGIPTADVYRQWDRHASSQPPGGHVWAADVRSAVELAPLLFNDLERAAFAYEPRLGHLRASLEREGGRPVRMTGSGSCLFAIFDSLAEAAGWQQRVTDVLEEQTAIRVMHTMHGVPGRLTDEHN